MPDAPLVFIDTETTGLHDRAEAWEIAMIHPAAQLWADDDPLTAGYYYTKFFVDVDLATAEPKALAVGGFYDRHPVGRWLSGMDKQSFRPTPHTISFASPARAAREVAQWTHGRHLVGVNPAFDAAVLTRLLHAHGLTPAWHYQLIDVPNLALGWLAAQGQEVPVPWKSNELAAACGVPAPEGEDRHTALGDARWAQRWYYAVTQPRKTPVTPR